MCMYKHTVFCDSHRLVFQSDYVQVVRGNELMLGPLPVSGVCQPRAPAPEVSI